MSKNAKTSHKMGLKAKTRLGNIIAHAVIIIMCAFCFLNNQPVVLQQAQ